jgi:hypothetical protein
VLLALPAMTTLAECEAIVQRSIEGFVHAGVALRTIRDKGLWQYGFETFEAYCLGRWRFGVKHAYKIIAAAEVVTTLAATPAGLKALPVVESQARPLVGLSEDEQVRAWSRALELAQDEQHTDTPEITARVVKAAVDELRDARAGSQEPKAESLDAEAALSGDVAEEVLSGHSTAEVPRAAATPIGDAEDPPQRWRDAFRACEEALAGVDDALPAGPTANLLEHVSRLTSAAARLHSATSDWQFDQQPTRSPIGD